MSIALAFAAPQSTNDLKLTRILAALDPRSLSLLR
jgi:hypothetical protein